MLVWNERDPGGARGGLLSIRSAREDLIIECGKILQRSESPEADALITPMLLDALRGDNDERTRTALFLLCFRGKPSSQVMDLVERISPSRERRVQEALRGFRSHWPELPRSDHLEGDR
jgi:hypothetical protein